jgi:hypothetical protein
MRTSVSLWAALGALALVLAGCDQATNAAKTSSSSDATSSTVYQIGSTWSGSTWVQSKIGVLPSSGRTISNATYTFAVNAATITGKVGAGWWVDGVWAATAEDLLTATANTWATLTLTDAVASPAATSEVVLHFWHGGSETLISVKSVSLTYSDGATEVLTFTTGASPVHSVLTVSGTATASDVAFSDRFWTYTENDTSSVRTEGVTTVAY